MSDKNLMMRVSWWLGRMKRVVPLLIAIFIGYEIWKSQISSHSASSTGNEAGISNPPAFVLSPPSTAPPPSQWLIVLVTSSMGDPCNRLAASFSGWTVLLVNLKKPQQTRYNTNIDTRIDGSMCIATVVPFCCSHSCCQYLSEEHTTSLLHQYGLKDDEAILAGVLYAIQSFAEVFYIPPAGIDLLSLEYPMLPNEHRTHWLAASVSAKSAKLSNPIHFGCNISAKQQRLEENSIKYKFVKNAPVIFASAAINLATQWARDFNDNKFALKLCDETAPSVVLEAGTYGDIRLDGAKVKYSAAWTFSSCLDGLAKHEDCLAWNLVVQNLLWKSGNTVMLYYNQLVNSNSSELPTSRSISLQRFLKKWSCPMKSFMACGINLIDQLSQSGYLSNEFATKQIAWFKALNGIDFNYPHLTMDIDQNYITSFDIVTFNPVNFSDRLPWLKGRKYPFSPVANHETTNHFFDGICEIPAGIPSKINVDFVTPWMQFEDILLIVVFNSPYYDNIRYIETMYRVFFPRILYCGPLPLDHKEFPWAKDYKLSFVMFDGDTNHTAGAFNYDCMIKAISMNYHVSGYLVIADDLLLLPHSLHTYNKHTAWYIPPEEVRIGEIKQLRECRLGMCDFHPHWHWWEDYQHSTIDALNNLMKQQHSDTFYKCYKQLITLNGAELRPNGAYSDIYYVPARLEQQVVELFEHFLQHRVFVEIAVPTVINCLVGTMEVEKLPGKQVWDVTRDMPWTYFKNEHLLGKKYFHPAKWSYIHSGSTEMREWFCTEVIPFLFDPYARIKKTRRL